MTTKPSEVVKSYATRPPLDELMAMDVDEVLPWWKFMSSRERRSWYSTGGRVFSKSTRVLAGIEIDDDVAPDNEAVNAFEVSRRKDVKSWLRRLKKVLGEMPEEIFISTGYDCAAAHVRTPDGECDHSGDTMIASLPGRWRGSAR